MLLHYIFQPILMILLLFSTVSGLSLNPLLDISIPNNINATVYSACSFTPLEKKNNCEILTSNNNHLIAVTQTVTTLCKRFPNEQCYCLLEASFSTVSCACGDGLLLSMQNMDREIPFSAAEDLWQPQIGLVKYDNDDSSSTQYFTKEDMEMLYPESFDVALLPNCEDKCSEVLLSYQHDICFAYCKSDNANTVKNAWKTDEVNTGKHLKDVSNEINSARTLNSEDIKGYDSPASKARTAWIDNLALQRSTLLAHLNTTISGYIAASQNQISWIASIGKIEEKRRQDEIKESELKRHEAFIAEQMSHMDDELIKKKLEKADSLLYALRAKYMRMTSEEIPDPVGDSVYVTIIEKGRSKKQSLVEILEKAENQLNGASSMLLKKGSDPQVMQMFNQYSKEVAEARGELLKYEPTVVESAALNAKLDVQVDALADSTLRKEMILTSNGSSIELNKIVKEEEILVRAIRQTKSKMARLLGSNVDQGSMCDTSLECGSKQSCIEHICMNVDSGSDCTSQNDCGNGHLCIGEKCSLTLDGSPCENSIYDCGNNMACVMGNCESLFPRLTSSVAEHTPCVSSGDCGLHQDCLGDRCIFVGIGIPCQSTNQCGNGANCTLAEELTSIDSETNTTLSVCNKVSELTFCTRENECGKNAVCDLERQVCLHTFGMIRGANLKDGHECDTGYDCGLNMYCKDSICVSRDLSTECKPAWPKGNGQKCESGMFAAVLEGNACDVQEDCGARQLCIGSICRGVYASVTGMRNPRSSSCFMNEDCAADNICTYDHCVELVQGSSCTETIQCGNGQICTDNKCTKVEEGESCFNGQSCAFGQLCIADKCRSVYGFNPFYMIEEFSPCIHSFDCGATQTCLNNTCTVVESGIVCEEDLLCGNGMSCLNYACTTIPLGSRCKEGTCGLNSICISGICREMFGLSKKEQDSLSPTLLTPDGFACVKDGDCGLAQSCSSFSCSTISQDSSCEVEDDCGNGQKCVSNSCHTIPGDSTCLNDSECGMNAVCADNICHSLFGSNPRVCPSSIGKAILQGATSRIEECLSYSLGTPAYEKAKDLLINNGVIRVEQDNSITALTAVSELCEEKESENVSFLQFSNKGKVKKGEREKEKRKKGKNENSLLLFQLLSPISSFSKITKLEDNSFQVSSSGVDIKSTSFSSSYVLAQDAFLTSSSASSVSSFTLLSTMSLPSSNPGGCLVQVGGVMVQFDADKRVTVKYVSPTDLQFVFISSPLKIEFDLTFLISLKWDAINKDVSMHVMSSATHWEVSKVEIETVLTNEDESNITINSANWKGESIESFPILGGVCDMGLIGKESHIFVSNIKVFKAVLDEKELRIEQNAMVSKSFILSSVSPHVSSCEPVSELHISASPSTLELLHWKLDRIDAKIACQDSLNLKESGVDLKRKSEQIFTSNSLKDMKDDILFELLSKIKGVGKDSFREEKSSLSESSNSLINKLMIEKIGEGTIDALFDTTMDCICKDDTWMKMQPPQIEEDPSLCLSYLIPSRSLSCKFTYQCSASHKCSSYLCKEVKEGTKCGDENDCGNGQACRNKKCVSILEGSPCLDGNICGMDQVCLSGLCRNAFGNSELGQLLRQQLLTSEIAAKKLQNELSAREKLVEKENELALLKLREQRKLLERQRLDILGKIRGAAAVRKGDLMKEITRLETLLESLKDQRDSIYKKEEEERQKSLKDDEALLSSLAYESSLRSGMEKRLAYLQSKIDTLNDDNYDEIIINGTRHTNCCGAISSGGSVWEDERKIGYLRGSPSVDGKVNELDREEAEMALCKANATAAAVIINEERGRLNDERVKWEEAVVRLTRPKTCLQLLGLATGGSDGVYTIFPYDYKEADGSDVHDYNGIQVYCDMTTDGGGWTLIGYTGESNQTLAGPLIDIQGAYNPTKRVESASISSLRIVRASTDIVIGWSDNYQLSNINVPNGGISSYQKAAKFSIPNPSDQNLLSDGGKRTCDSPFFTPVSVACIVGECDLPTTMYTGTDSLSVCEGHAYGLVANTLDEKGNCDWRIGFDNTSKGMSALYIGMDNTVGCSGVVDAANNATEIEEGNIALMSIWVR